MLGYPVNDYIQQVRPKKSLHLFQQDNCSIAEVANQVGFASPIYFPSAFKASYRMTQNGQEGRVGTIRF